MRGKRYVLVSSATLMAGVLVVATALAALGHQAERARG
jgi:hypothetical protein